MIGNFWRRFSGYIDSTVKWLSEKINSFTIISSETAKSSYLFQSRLFTFHSLVQVLLPTSNCMNGVSQPISVEYKMVHSLNQAVFRTKNLGKLGNLGFFFSF